MVCTYNVACVEYYEMNMWFLLTEFPYIPLALHKMSCILSSSYRPLSLTKKAIIHAPLLSLNL